MKARIHLLLLSVLLSACAPSWPPDPVYPEQPTLLSVQPEDPIEGERVRAIVPTDNDGDCYSWQTEPVITPPEEGTSGPTRVVIEAHNPEGQRPCSFREGMRMGGSLYELGALPAGDYLLVVGGVERPFSVRPADADPGPVPIATQVALAVAARYTPGGCFGMPGAEAPEDRWTERAPRLFHQLAAAHPDWSPEQVNAALHRAQSVSVREVGGGEYRYRFDDGRCCHIEEKIGTAWVREGGRIEVGSPHTIRSEDVPC